MGIYQYHPLLTCYKFINIVLCWWVLLLQFIYYQNTHYFIIYCTITDKTVSHGRKWLFILIAKVSPPAQYEGSDQSPQVDDITQPHWWHLHPNWSPCVLKVLARTSTRTGGKIKNNGWGLNNGCGCNSLVPIGQLHHAEEGSEKKQEVKKRVTVSDTGFLIVIGIGLAVIIVIRWAWLIISCRRAASTWLTFLYPHQLHTRKKSTVIS